MIEYKGPLAPQDKSFGQICHCLFYGTQNNITSRKYSHSFIQTCKYVVLYKKGNWEDIINSEIFDREMNLDYLGGLKCTLSKR